MKVTRRKKKKKPEQQHQRVGSEKLTVLGVDLLSARMTSLASRKKTGIREELEAAAEEIECETFRLLPDDCVLSRETSVRILRNWMGRLEKKIAEIAATESRFFWLQLIARIAPKNVLKVDPSTVWLYRQTLKLAVAKYGGDSGRKLVSTLNGDRGLFRWAMEGADGDPVPTKAGRPSILLPSHLTTKDVMDAYVLERLAAQFCLCTSGLRVVWKGGHVVVENRRFAGIDSNPAIEEMYQLYDQRNRLTGVVRGAGSLAGSDALADVDRLPMLVPYLNVREVEIAPEIFAPGEAKGLPVEVANKGEGFLPNYLMSAFELGSLCRFMNVFDEELRSRWGCSGTEICAMIGAVGISNGSAYIESGAWRWQLAQRGYTICPSYRRFRQIYEPMYELAMTHLTGSVGERGRFGDVFALLTYRDFDSIDLWERLGSRPFLEFERGIMVDHSMLMFVAHTMLAPLASARGATGRKKGENFEHELRELLRRRVENWSEWKFRERIHFTRHFEKARGEREIDVSFVHQDCLFVVSCKAANFGPVLDRGEGKAIWRRFEAIQEWLAEVDEVVGALADEPEGADYCVPKGIGWIVGMCCSPHVDYFPVRTPDLFLSDRVPRMCVPEELLEFLGRFDAKEEAAKGAGWIRKIERS